MKRIKGARRLRERGGDWLMDGRREWILKFLYNETKLITSLLCFLSSC